jgi:anti-sigma factor RsiW
VRSTSTGGQDGALCEELLARYGDYIDGQLSPLQAARLQLHLEVCGSCARYDRIMSRGLELVRELPDLTPSHDFEERLQHRLYHADDAAALAAQRPAAGAVAAFAVAGVIALLAWSPMLLSTDDGTAVVVANEQRREPTRAQPAYMTPVPARTNAPVHVPLTAPLHGAGDLWQPAVAVPPLSSGDMSRILAAFPGPYSPLVVNPPVHGRSVRTVSTEYAPND